MNESSDTMSPLAKWQSFAKGESSLDTSVNGVPEARPARVQYRRSQAHDEEVDVAMTRVLRAALDQRRPSRVLVRVINEVLPIIGHPLALKTEKSA